MSFEDDSGAGSRTPPPPDRRRPPGRGVTRAPWWCQAGSPGTDGPRAQIAKDNAQAAKDLAHLLRLLGVDNYEEATVVLFDLTRRGHLPAAPMDPKDAGPR